MSENEETGPQDGADAAQRTETVIESMVGAHAAAEGEGHNINAMLNVALNVQIVLGQCRMPIQQLLSLSRGSVIELDKKIGEPVDVMINDRLVARGDLVKVGENRIGVTLTEIVKDYVNKRN
ncbi:flagellar motor switch protein FliN [Thioclava sp. BHET1]|nr:flagellar motor switch protein FliN [Thioclava sp. BHET1]